MIWEGFFAEGTGGGMEKGAGTGWGGRRESEKVELSCALANDMAAAAYQGPRFTVAGGDACMHPMCGVWRRKGKSWDDSEQCWDAGMLSWRILRERIAMDVGIRPIKPLVAEVARPKRLRA